MADPNANKNDHFIVIQEDTKETYKCLHCKRKLSSKRNILQHLHSRHEFSPVKKVKKRYLYDTSEKIPRRTQIRLDARKQSSLHSDEPKVTTTSDSRFNTNLTSNALVEMSVCLSSGESTNTDQDDTCSMRSLSVNKVEYLSNTEDLSVLSDEHTHADKYYQVHSNKQERASHEDENNDLGLCGDDHVQSCRQNYISSNYDTDGRISYYSDEGEDQFDSILQMNDSDNSLWWEKSECNSNRSFSALSDQSSQWSCSTMSSSSSSENDYLSSEASNQASDPSTSSSDEDLIATQSSTNKHPMSAQESQSLAILSCFLRHNLTASASKDILDTMKKMFPESKAVHTFDYNKMWKSIGKDEFREIHYCPIKDCYEVFPGDPEIFRCSKQGCLGLRYKGPLSSQLRKGRQPRQSFVFADTPKQLQSLLESPGILEQVTRNKKIIQEGNSHGVITDITDGISYRALLEEGEFLALPNNISGIFNTDGVNLYSSSRVELWPIFVAINELSPEFRFSREKMLLVGIWQGKGKPPFKQYMHLFGEQMNLLYDEGITIKLGNEQSEIFKLAIICCTSDLPAKAGILNMTYFNGTQACIACEEPGKIVDQGKGHSNCYPYRNEADRFPMRTPAAVIENMENGTDKKRQMGFKGKSGLITLKGFNIVTGMVPDYMHGVLLGVTKTLMDKWFSTTHRAKGHFIGKKLPEISKRLELIKPPDFIQRLPRNLEKHYMNFKATELQAWLLFYAIPCLTDILPEEYLNHFTLLSEAVFIVLGDDIGATDMARAETLFHEFYKDFEALYGSGSCGLNVHNIGRHLTFYVRQWGPVWAWSTFAFEDSNALLLQSVHGTGSVVKQVMRVRTAQAMLRKAGFEPQSKIWTKTKLMSNCTVGSTMKMFADPRLQQKIMEIEGTNDNPELFKVDKILKDEHKFYSAEYSRMRRRTTNVALIEGDRVGFIKKFVVAGNYVYAVVEYLETMHSDRFNAGKHLIQVKTTEHVDLISVEHLIETVLYVSCRNDGNAVIARMPNAHGYSVFK